MTGVTEPAKGTEKQNIDYYKKEGDYFEVGKTIEVRIDESKFNTLRHIMHNDQLPEKLVLQRDD